MIQLALSFSGKPRQASMAAYRQLLAENHVEEILADVKQNKNLDRKKELPVWLPLAECFNNGTRKAEDAVASGLFFLDIDEKGLTEALWKKVQEENLIEEFRIVYFAESAGGGTHIWAWRTPGLSIEEDIQKLASRLGVSYDSHVTDLARCCFMVSEQYVKLLDPVVFEPLTEEQRKLYAQPIINKVEQVEVETVQASGVSENPNYKGIPYEKSAVGSTRPAEMPSPMKEVLTSMGTVQEASAECVDDAFVAPVDDDLPGILQEIADHAPEEFKEASLIASMPMLGTLATSVRAKYRDGELNSASFIVSIEAPQATGKSFADKLFYLLMDPIIKQDEVEWQKEIAYSLAKKDGQDVENPCSNIRIIEPNIGVSALLERALYAKGKHLFTRAPEIETVLKNNKGGAWTEKNDLFRLAYDNKPWGQHRISKDSFSGKVTLYYNILMCGTPNKCRAFFADVESGLVSRVTPVVLPDMVGAKMPKFKTWTKEEEEKVKRQCLCLMDEEGEVDLPLINQAIEEWDESKRQEYLQTLRYSLDVFRRRAALNGFRAGIVAYLLEGRKETERAIKFAVWYAERCLHYQLQIYGDKIDALHNGQLSTQAAKGNIRYLDALPKEFTKEDLVSLRLSNNESPVVKTIIYRWGKEGKIEKIDANLWRKI